MQIKIHELGRSMVEMLGTLAIIGVLSIGGIIGYGYAIDKNRANETINELQIRALDLSRQMINGATTLTMDEMGYKTSVGYPISARISPNFDNFFEIFLDDVPSGVCKQLMKSRWSVPYSIFVNTTEYKADEDICGEAETVRLAYEFQEDLMAGNMVPEEEKHEIKRCNTSGDCKCGDCVDGLCESYCPAGSKCVKSYDDARGLMCCQSEYVVGDLCCASINAQGECCNSDDLCCPPDKPLQDKDGFCYSCDEPLNVNVYGVDGNCAVCEKRYLAGGYDTKSWCSLCGVKGTSVEDKPLSHYLYSSCYSCEYDKKIEQIGIRAAYFCDNVCPNRNAHGTDCYPACNGDTPLSAHNGCFSCTDTTQSYYADVQSDTCSNLCSNRKEQNGYCVIIDECPAERPLMGADGKCYACDDGTNGNINVWGVEENCSRCPKRFLAGTIEDQKRSICSLCGVEGSSFEESPLIYNLGGCYSCDYYLPLQQYGQKEEYRCEKVCPDRLYYNTQCYQACSGDTPLRNGKGCFACDNTTESFPMYLQSGDCSTLCSDREEKNGYCIVSQTCPTNKPLQDVNGFCYACDDPQSVNVRGITDNCGKCPDRFLTGDDGTHHWCVACGMAGTEVADKPLAEYWTGTCYECDSTKKIDQAIIPSGKKCENICPNRYSDLDSPRYCLRTTCSETKPLEDASGECHACNETSPINVGGDGERCAVCINRKIQGDNCILE